ncbi:MAG: iron-containing alcohol dehydrogenase [Deltaproteobacteria bacterium]|nr:iron-containing alcohol dehydrogenase [Deltaproteobacteria bacterium]MBM4323319.1 iron-containing alcohol dehydrogenase [Deltaproteobacteria bacterium]MBM4347126.1 iron-containing alcohol dehydrogenase [Deltaproteobacteria bacterium]
MEKLTLFRTTKRILFGLGAVEKTGAEAQLLKAKKVLIITDQGVIQAGLLETVEKSLQAAGLPFVIFDGVEPDPRIEVVEKSVEKAKKEGIDLIIGFGGGSSLDIAKVTSILLTNPGKIDGLFGIDLVPNPGIPVILVPTTAGTGSEVTPIAILSDTKEKLKKGIVSPFLFPEVAIVDPKLTIGLPPSVTAFTGMDALTHAIEAYASINATDLTDLFAFRALELISQNIRIAYANGENLTARSNMMEGSLLAGIAFANAGVGAVHAFAYPLGGEFHLAHGLTNTLMLPYVMRYNILGCPEKFAQMAKAFGEKAETLSVMDGAETAVKFVERLSDDIRVPRRLRDVGVPENAIPRLAEAAMKVTRLLANNPRKIALDDAIAIYNSAY